MVPSEIIFVSSAKVTTLGETQAYAVRSARCGDAVVVPGATVPGGMARCGHEGMVIMIDTK